MPLSHPSRSRFASLLTAVAATAGATACRSDAATAAPAAPESARLQVINAARTPVDVLVDGTVRVSALPAASVSPLLAVGEGARRLDVRVAGSDTGRVTTQVTAQASSTALVAARVGATGALSAAVVSDTAPIPAPGTSKLRVLHLAPNAPEARIWVLGPGQAAKSANASAYGSVTPWRYGGSTSFFQGAPGSWDVVITPVTFVGGNLPASDTTPAPGGPQDPHAYATARLLVPVAADQARTVVMLDAPGGGVRLETTGAP